MTDNVEIVALRLERALRGMVLTHEEGQALAKRALERIAASTTKAPAPWNADAEVERLRTYAMAFGVDVEEYLPGRASVLGVQLEMNKQLSAKADRLEAAAPKSPTPCPYCKSSPVHLHNCLEIMNRERTPTGDWWRI